jgi:hypothetical protein
MEMQEIKNSNPQDCLLEFVENYKKVLKGLGDFGYGGDLKLVSLACCSTIILAKMNYEADEDFIDGIRKVSKSLSSPHLHGLIDLMLLK